MNNKKDVSFVDLEWEGDVLSRKKYSVFLTNFLINKKEGCVVNINAPWGEGKTFFLEKWHKDLSDNHPTVFFNAWESDFSDDPLISVISSIYDQVIPLLPTNEQNQKAIKNFLTRSGDLIKKVTPILVKGAAGKLIGEGGVEELSEISKEVENTISDVSSQLTEEFLKTNKDRENTIINFRESISILIEKTKTDDCEPPLFIFIDELDRCRPLYAIELLERIKHLFGISDVIFIVATDTEQLSCSVKAIYGESFKGDVYLRRFFDQIFTLPKPHCIDFPKVLFKEFSSNKIYFNYYINFMNPSHENCLGLKDGKNAELILLFALFADFFDMDLRTQAQCYDRFLAIDSSLNNDDRIHFAYLIFLIMLYAYSQDKFNEFFLQHSDIQVKLKIIDSIGKSKLTLRVSGAYYRAIDFINKYSRHIFMDKKDLENTVDRIDNIENKSADDHIIFDIFLKRDSLLKYKKMVEMSALIK